MTTHENGTGALQDAHRKVAELHEALQSRHVIGVAQGLLMARFGLSTDQAFEYLRRRSQDENVKLRTLADDLVTRWHEDGCRLVEFDPV